MRPTNADYVPAVSRVLRSVPEIHRRASMPGPCLLRASSLLTARIGKWERAWKVLDAMMRI